MKNSSNKNVDIIEALFGGSNISQNSPDYLNKIIIYAILRSMFQDMSDNWDTDKLNEYIKDIVAQSLGIKDNSNCCKPNAEQPVESDCVRIIGQPSEVFCNDIDEQPAQADNNRVFDQPAPPAEKSNLQARYIGIQPQILETHSMVIIRIELPCGISEKDLRITVNTDHIAIKWPFGYMEQIIPLPEGIEESSTNAIIKDRILEINISRKNNGDVRQINI